MKGRTKKHANWALDELTRREGGRGHHLGHPPEQADRRPAPRHVPWHVIAQRRARRRMRAVTRKAQRR